MEEYYFVGLLLGKLLLDGLLCPAHLSLVLRKRLLNAPIKFQDLQGVDQELFKSLEWIKDNNITDVIYETFTFTDENDVVRELKPGGSAIEVTELNKIEWLTLRVRFALLEVAKEETEALREGLYEVIPPRLLSAFSCSELEFLLSGMSEIDVADWMQHTVYKNCNSSTAQVRWFWNVVTCMSDVDRCKLLSFATGCANLPVEGFVGLRSARGVSRMFQISLVPSPNSSRLPQAHTCFNTLDLPDYSSQDELERMLRVAIEEGAEGFFVTE
eukprot:TRINITY_DN18803_c0_g1_i2.p1 TRINITY_DN18803_c0_g1~~TRINITY_DN18803_c0_g1_i2.p1  ORF type:complete len:271 (+),score=62.13 TRINITY_DN18803_c0_g1_i2:128-940(+)